MCILGSYLVMTSKIEKSWKWNKTVSAAPPQGGDPHDEYGFTPSS